jgi:hypothetical protein
MSNVFERIRAMEEAMTTAKHGPRFRDYVLVSVHVMLTSGGWVLFINSQRSGPFQSMEDALDAAERYTSQVVNGDRLLAETLGVAS